MSELELFTFRHRKDMDYSKDSESPYDFYDRSAIPEMSEVRDRLNVWFKNYPSAEKLELRNRFKKSFSSAFYELFLHELFLRQGFRIICHPKLEHTNRRPDFLISKGDFEYYVEAKVATGKTEAEIGLARKLNQLFDNINKIEPSGFALWIKKIEFKSSRQPSARLIIAWIKEQIEIAKYGTKGMKTCQYEHEDVAMEIRLWPLLEKHKDEQERVIGAYPTYVKVGGEENKIKAAIKEKVNRYGKLDKPYIVCINAISINGDEKFDIENTLWGSLALSFSVDGKKEKWVRSPDGIFWDGKKFRHQQLSGVFIAKIFEHNIHYAKHWFVKHPVSNNPAHFGAFDLSYCFVQDDELKTATGKTIAEIFK